MSRGSYRAIHTVLLDGPDYQALAPETKLVLLTLKLNLGPSGMDVLYPAVIEAQTGLSAKDVAAALAALERTDWIRRDRNVCWVIEGLKYEPSRSLDNRNHRQEITEHLAALPRLAIVDDFRRYYELDRPTQAMPALPPSSRNGLPDGPGETLRDAMGDGIGDGMGEHGGSETEEVKRRKGNLSSPVADATAEEFDRVWPRYPQRFGGNPRRAAFKAYQARRREGVPATDLAAGVERYRAYCEATRKVGTEFVKQGSTFFGPNGFYAEPWEVRAGAAPDDPLAPAALRDRFAEFDLTRSVDRASYAEKIDRACPAGMDPAAWQALVLRVRPWELGRITYPKAVDDAIALRLATAPSGPATPTGAAA